MQHLLQGSLPRRFTDLSIRLVAKINTALRMSETVEIGGSKIPVTATQPDTNIRAVLAFSPFKEWVATLSNQMLNARKRELEIKGIEVQNVDFFGPRVGFIKFKVDARLVANGANVPGIVFMRGGSVAVLLILRSMQDGVESEHVVLVRQARLPVPTLNFDEIPAGMLDGSGNFVGKASEEIKEETGIQIHDHELIDMTELAYENEYRGAYPSPGGCDEFIRLYLCVKEMKSEEVRQLEGKLTGLQDSGESITVKLVKLDELWRVPDMKALSALALYDALRRKGKITRRQ